MADILNMKIIIEGIEFKEQIELLRKSNYIKYQGYHFHKPMEFHKLKPILKTDK
jgi:EAL domain-containing protein (putative c-di-GMP-specific phosphodiesterase class I)